MDWRWIESSSNPSARTRETNSRHLRRRSTDADSTMKRPERQCQNWSRLVAFDTISTCRSETSPPRNDPNWDNIETTKINVEYYWKQSEGLPSAHAIGRLTRRRKREVYTTGCLECASESSTREAIHEGDQCTERPYQQWTWMLNIGRHCVVAFESRRPRKEDCPMCR